MTVKSEVHFKDGMVMFHPHTLELMLRREREKEREACASICFQEGPSIDGELIANAIRARNV